MNDGDKPTWRGLYDAYASLGGWEVRNAPAGEEREAACCRPCGARRRRLPRAPSPTMLPRAAQARARDAIVASTELPSPELAALQTSDVRYRTDHAREVLGYDPPVSFERGLGLTADWLRFARLL